jgi:hypothetical protein
VGSGSGIEVVPVPEKRIVFFPLVLLLVTVTLPL